MGVRTVPHLLGMLHDDPDDLGLLTELREAVGGKDPERLGSEPLRQLLEATEAQSAHGEHELAVALLELAATELADGPVEEARLRVSLGELHRDELLDDEAAQRSFARAIELDSKSKGALVALQGITDATLQLETSVAELLEREGASLEDKIRAACLLWQHGEQEGRSRAESLFTKLVGQHPEEARPARLWARALRSEGRWKDMEDVLATSALDCSDARARLSFALRAGRVAAGPLEDVEAAESHYRIALSQDPGNPEALRVLVNQYTETERWDDLLGIYNGALDVEPAPDSETQVGILTQLAMVYWRILEKPDLAAPYFKRLQAWVPDHPSLRLYEEEFGPVGDQDVAPSAANEIEPADSDKATVQMDARPSDDEQEADANPSEEQQTASGSDEEAASSTRDSIVPTSKKGKQVTKRMRRLEKSLRKAKTPAKRAQILANLARAQQDGDQSVERSIQAWQRVLEEDPSHVEARREVRDLYRVAEKWNALVESIQDELSDLAEEKTERRVELLRELIPVYRDGLGLGVMVAKTYKQLLRVAPEDVDALDELCRTHEEQRRWNDLIQALGRRADVEPAPAERIGFYRRIAGLWIERFKNYNQARRPLERVLEIDPEHRETLSDLRSIYRKKRAWQPLCDVLNVEANLVSDEGSRVVLLRELAELVDEKIADPKRALEAWSQVLELDPADLEAEQHVARLAERLGEWNKLALALEARVGRPGEAAEKMAAYRQLGAVYSERLEDYDSARRIWEAALSEEPDNARARRSLRDILVRSGDWDALEEVFGGNADWDALAEVLGKAAEDASQPQTVIALSLRAAAVYRDKLGEPHRAFRHYERIIKLEPTHREAAECLVPIYERDEKWTRLPGLLETLLETAPGISSDDSEEIARKAGVMAKLYGIARDQLGDKRGALRWALLGTSLGHEEESWIERLSVVAGELGEWEQLRRALDARADRLEGELLHENRLRVVDLLINKEGEREAGIKLLQELLSENPSDMGLVQALEELYVRGEDDEDLLRLYRHRLEHGPQDPTVQVEVLLALAELEEAAGRVDEAVEHYRAIVEALPGDDVGLGSLDRLLTTKEAWDELVDVLERRAELASDEDERVSLLSRLCAVHYTERKDAAAAMDTVEAAHALAPDDDVILGQIQALESEDDNAIAERAAELLEERYETAEEWDELAALLGRRRRRTEDPVQVEAIQLRLAELSGEQLGDFSAAFEVLQSAFLTRPDDEALERRLERAAARSDNQSREADLYAQILKQGSLGSADSVRFGMKRARLLLSGDGTDSDAVAEAQLREVLEHDPLHQEAFDALKERFVASESWAELKAHYESRIDNTLDELERVELLLQISGLLEDVESDGDYIVECYRRVLAIEPGNRGASRRLERLYRQGEQWRDLASLITKALPDLEGQERVDSLLELAEIEADHGGSARVALESLEAVLEDNARHLKAQEGLHRLLSNEDTFERASELLIPIYEEQGAWAELSEVLGLRLDKQEAGAGAADDYMQLAEIAELRLHDTEGAFSWIAKAVSADPARADLRSELERVAVIRDAQATRAEVLETALKAAGDDDFIRAEILEDLARLTLDFLDNETRAEEHYLELIKCDPDNVERVITAYRALRRIHRATGNEAALVQDVQGLADLVSDEQEAAELWQEAARLYENEGAAPSDAIRCYRRFLELRPDDVDATDRISALLEVSGGWDELIEILESIETEGLSDDARYALAERISGVYAEQLDDADRAVAVLEDAVSERGARLSVLTRLAGLYRAAERWTDLTDTLRQAAPMAETESDQLALLVELAQVFARELKEYEPALDVLDDLLAEHPDSEEALATAVELCSNAEEKYIQYRAAEILARVHTVQERFSALLAALDVLAESEEPEERLKHLARGYRVAAEYLGGGELALDWLLRALRVAATTESSDFEELLADLERLIEETGAWERAVEALESFVDDVFVEERRTGVLRRLGSWCAEHLESPERARTHFESLLENEPESEEALAALQPLLTAANDHQALFELLGRRAELDSDPDNKLEFMLLRARLAEEKLEDPSLALDVAEESMQVMPSGDALEILVRIYTQREDWFELGSALERAIEEALRPREELHHQLAELAANHLEDEERALDEYANALSEAAGFKPTLESLLKLTKSGDFQGRAAGMLEAEFGRQESWDQVCEMLEVQIAVTEDPEEKREALRRLGVTHEECREDLASALDAYARMWGEDTSDSGSWQTFLRVAKALDDAELQADLLVRVLKNVEFDDELSAAACKLTGSLLSKGETTREGAIVYYERTLRFEPADAEAYEALAELREEFERWEDLAEQHRVGMSETESEEERASIGHRLATVLGSQLDDAQGALDLYRDLFEMNRSDNRAAEAIERLLAGAESWDELAEFVADRAVDIESAEARAGLLFQQASLVLNKLDEVERALEISREALDADPTNADFLQMTKALLESPEWCESADEILDGAYRASDEWAALADLLEKRADRHDDAMERSELLREAALLYEERGNDHERALEACSRAFVLFPDAGQPLQDLLRLADYRGAWESIAAVLEAGVPRAENPEDAADILGELAYIQDTRRGDPRGASRSYRRIISIAPEREEAVEHYENLVVMLGDWTALADLLTERAELALAPEEKSGFFRRAGVIRDEMLSDEEGAIQAFQDALSEDESDVAALTELDRLYVRLEDYERLAEVLDRRIELSDAPEDRVSLCLRLAMVTQHELERPEEAVQAYRRILEDEPTHEHALGALAELYIASESWDDVLDVRAAQVEVTEDPAERAKLMVSSADICREHLARLAEALDMYRDALSDEAGNQRALDGLAQIGADDDYLEETWQLLEGPWASQGEWDHIAGYLARLANHAFDEQDKVRFLRRLVEVHELQRNDAESAFDVLIEMTGQGGADDIGIQDILRLGRATKRWAQTVDAVEAAASEHSDPDAAKALWLEAASLAEREWKEPLRAVTAYERAAEASGETPAIWEGLARCHEALEAWDDLVDVLESWAAGAEDSESRHAAMVRLAVVRAERFDDQASSMAVVRDIVEENPEHEEGLAALVGFTDEPALRDEAFGVLEDAYRKSESYAKLGTLFDMRIERATEASSKRALLLDAASLWEEALEDLERAISLTSDAWRLEPGDTDVLDRMESLAEQGEAWSSLRGVVESVVAEVEMDSWLQRDVQMRAAVWYGEKMDDWEAAEASLRGALDADPKHDDAYANLLEVLRAQEKSAEAVEVMMTWAGTSADDDHALELFAEAAQLAEATLDDNKAAADCYAELLKRKPEHPDYLEALVRLRRAEENWTALAERLAELVAVTEDGESKTALRHELAKLYRTEVPNRQGAIDVYRSLLSEESADEDALIALSELYEEAESWDDLAAILEQRIELNRAEDKPYAQWLSQLGDLHLERRHQPEEASQAFVRLREIEPQSEHAFTRLDSIFRSTERWESLRDLLLERATIHEMREEIKRAVACLLDAAELSRERLDDEETAISSLTRLLEWDAQNEGALVLLEEIFEKSGRWEELLDFLDERLEVREGDDATQTALRIATLSLEKLEDDARAESALRYVLEESPGHEVASKGLRDLLTRTERWRELAEFEESAITLIDEADTTARKAAWLELAVLHDERTGDVEGALGCLEKASALDPDDRDLLDRLCASYVSAGRAAEAIPVLEQIVGTFGGRRSKEAAVYLHRLGEAKLGIGDEDGALEHFDAAFRIDLTNVDILRDLGRLCLKREDFARAQKTFRALLLQRLGPDAGLVKADVYAYIGECQLRLGEQKKAKAMLKRALDEDPEHSKAVELLAELEGS